MNTSEVLFTDKGPNSGRKLDGILTPEQVGNFLSKIEKTEGKQCWKWTGATTDGYGNFGLNGKVERAQRVSYLHFIGPIPRGKCVLHSCDNPPCCNPDHLFLGTQTENISDMCRKGRKVSISPEKVWTAKHPEMIQGVLNPAAKLTEANVMEIRNLKRKGVLEKTIADRYGVTPPCVGYIVRRKTWKHIK